MNEFDPNIELIDRYLRGELQGTELETFMTKLQSDSSFKAEFEQREKIASVIYAYGRAQMKQYLKQKTRHRGLFYLSKKSWYFAAASVIIIGFASAILLWKLNPAVQKDIPFAKTKTDTATAKVTHEETWTGQAKNKISPADTAQKSEIIAQNTENNNSPELEPTEENIQSITAAQDPIIIAANVQAVAISLYNITDAPKSLKAEAAEIKRARVAEADDQPPVTGQNAKVKQPARTEAAAGDYRQTEEIKIRKTPMRFSFTFFETPGNNPMLEIDKYNDMYFVRCYDIVYGNPLVYEYQGRYFLHSGIKAYELKNLPSQNGQKVSPTAAQEVTDPYILNLIGR